MIAYDTIQVSAEANFVRIAFQQNSMVKFYVFSADPEDDFLEVPLGETAVPGRMHQIGIELLW